MHCEVKYKISSMEICDPHNPFKNQTITLSTVHTPNVANSICLYQTLDVIFPKRRSNTLWLNGR